MKKLAFTGLFCAAALFAGHARSASGSVLFYDGDPSGSLTLDVHVYVGAPDPANESFRDFYYSDFAVPAGQTYTVTGMFGNFANADPTAATASPNFEYQIRTGMSGSNPGTLVYSATGIPTATTTNLNDTIATWPGYAYSINLPSSITLTGGQSYWVAMIPITTDGFNVGIQTTSNANSINSLKDGVGEYDSWLYTTHTDSYSAVNGDVSVGLTGTLTRVPEPASVAFLAISGAATLARRRH
jgi:hypothetical protein